MAADRAQHVAEVVAPGPGRRPLGGHRPLLGVDPGLPGLRPGLDLDELAAVVDWATGGIEPDLNVLVDVPAEVARRRRSGGGPTASSGLDAGFHERVRRRVPGPGRGRPDRWVVVDGDGRRAAAVARRRWLDAGRRAARAGPPQARRERRPPSTTSSRPRRRRPLRRGGRPGPGGGRSSGPRPAVRSTPICSSGPAGLGPASAWPGASPPPCSAPTAAAGTARPAAGRSPASTPIWSRSSGPGPLSSVDDARRLVAPGPAPTPRGRRQVVVVSDVHLARLAAPALLKTLEEPAGDDGLRAAGRRRPARARHHGQPVRRGRPSPGAGRRSARLADRAGGDRRARPPTWPRRPGAASTGPGCSPRTPASGPGRRCGARCPTRLDGTGAAAGGAGPASSWRRPRRPSSRCRAGTPPRWHGLEAEAAERWASGASRPAQGHRGPPAPRGTPLAGRRAAGRARGAGRAPTGTDWPRRSRPAGGPAEPGRSRRAERARRRSASSSGCGGRARPQPQRVADARGPARPASAVDGLSAAIRGGAGARRVA